MARWRWTRLKSNEQYQQVAKLKNVLDGLDGAKFEKPQAFLVQPVSHRVKTNNHVDRMNRKLRFAQKVRYKGRRRKSVIRFVLLKIGLHHPQPRPQGPGGAGQGQSGRQASGNHYPLRC